MQIGNSREMASLKLGGIKEHIYGGLSDKFNISLGVVLVHGAPPGYWYPIDLLRAIGLWELTLPPSPYRHATEARPGKSRQPP